MEGEAGYWASPLSQEEMEVSNSPPRSQESVNALLSRECSATELPRCAHPQGASDHDYTDLSPVIAKLGTKLETERLASFAEAFGNKKRLSYDDSASSVLKPMNSSGSDTNGDFNMSQKRKRSPRPLDISDEENFTEEQLIQLRKQKKKRMSLDNAADNLIEIQESENSSELAEKSKIFPAPCSELKYVALRGESLLDTTSDGLNASSEADTSLNCHNSSIDFEGMDEGLNSSTLSSSTTIEDGSTNSGNTSKTASTDEVPEFINFEALDDTDLSAEINASSANGSDRVLRSKSKQNSMEVDQLRANTPSSTPRVSSTKSLHYLSPISNPPEQEQLLISSDEEMAGPSNVRRLRGGYDEATTSSGQPVSKGDSLDELPAFFTYSTDEPKGWDSDEDLDESEKAAKQAKAAAAASRNKVVASTPQNQVVSSTPRNQVIASTPQNQAVASTSGNKLVVSTPQNQAVASTSGNKFVSSTPQNQAVASTSRNPHVASRSVRPPNSRPNADNQPNDDDDDDDLPAFVVSQTDDHKGWESEDVSDDEPSRPPTAPKAVTAQQIIAAARGGIGNWNAIPARNLPSSDDETYSDDYDSYDSLDDGRYFETANWRSPYNRNHWVPRRRSNRWGRTNRWKRNNRRNPPEETSYLFSHFPRSKNNSKNGDVTREESRLTVETLHELSTSVQQRPTANVRESDPKEINVRLLPHQQHALAWMIWRENAIPSGGILADDMGLGKTLTAIALIMKSLETEKHKMRVYNGRERGQDNLGGTLIVCPANLILQWYHEINRRTKINSEVRNVNIYHAMKERRLDVLASYAVVITSYDTLTNNFEDNKILFRIRWKRVILDEAHVVRNPRTKRSMCLTSLSSEKRWMLTGTPIHNKTKDVFPLIRFLQVRPFNESRSFTRWIDNRDIAGEQRLRFVMDSIMLRRTKATLIAEGLMPDLPLKTKRSIEITLELEERSVYDKVMTFSQTLFMQFLHQRQERARERDEGAAYRRNEDYCTVQLNKRQQRFLARRGPVQHHHILTLILRLRQICCHPALIRKMLEKDDFCDAGLDEKKVDDQMINQANNLLTGEALFGEVGEDEADQEVGVDENIIEKQMLNVQNPVFNEERRSSKMVAVLEKVREIVVEKNEKVIIVSDWVGYLGLIGTHLNSIPGATYCFYTGRTKYNDRDNIVNSFNTQRNPMVLLLSLRAGGQGLNLMAANHVILVDIHWNPQLEVQAQDRVWRIGQTKDVFIHKLLCVDTIEERIIALQNKKLQIADNVLSCVGRNDRLGIDELRTLFNV